MQAYTYTHNSEVFLNVFKQLVAMSKNITLEEDDLYYLGMTTTCAIDAFHCCVSSCPIFYNEYSKLRVKLSHVRMEMLTISLHYRK